MEILIAFAAFQAIMCPVLLALYSRSKTRGRVDASFIAWKERQ